MTTYRERRELRAERLREWADKRETKAVAAYDQAHARAGMIPFGQPILVGHHSEGRDRRFRASIEAGARRGHEHATKAAAMRSKADNIEAAAASAIYNDDPDAPERLAEKLARLEAERDRIKAFNTSCRKGAPNVELLDARQRADYASVRAHSAYSLGKRGEMPGYALSNLSATIRTTRQRLERLSK